LSRLISIVIPTLNEGVNLRKTVISLQNTLDCDYEIIVVDNGSTDGSSDFISQDQNNSRVRLFNTERLGVANARNFGARQAHGDFIFFVDAHMLFPKGWMEPMLKNIERAEVGIVAPTIAAWGNSSTKGYGFKWRNSRLDMLWLKKEGNKPYPVAMVAGMFQGFRAKVFFEIGCYDSGMISFGSEDAEICLRAWTLGYEVCLVPEVEIAHLFRSKHPYKVQWQEVVYNMLRVVVTHFNTPRKERCLKSIRSFPSFDSAYQRLQNSDIRQRREYFAEKRVLDDEWFFKRFQMGF
jgi:glycosyltransferase involved in cell wall biosynthesis